MTLNISIKAIPREPYSPIPMKSLFTRYSIEIPIKLANKVISKI